ncbi:MAG: EAL domain-containing protein [Acidobacteriia bacterium]|nr:EAL domain-containing protein [Terriglobia bacterium]
MATPEFVVVGTGDRASTDHPAGVEDAGQQSLDLLSAICRMVEGQRAGTLCSLIQVRDEMLYWSAAPGFPQAALALLNSVRAAPAALNLSGAEPARSATFWEDIRSCPIWAGCADLAAGLGVESCLAAPIVSTHGQALGMVMLHYRRGLSSTDADRDLLQLASHMAAIAIARRELQEKLELQVRHDALTGLPNRPHFMELLSGALREARERAGTLAVLCIGLDRFQQINDTLGHAMGDRLLQEAAHRLRERLHADDLAGRVGGDEFSVVLTRQPDEQRAARAAQELLNAFRAPVQVDGHELFVTASIGLAMFPDHGSNAAELLRNADVSMHRVKSGGRNAVEVFRPENHSEGLERLRLETALRRALENREFEVRYQPVVDMRGRVQGLEALLTWRHPAYGTISPGQFIPIAEETGLIIDIGAWVLEQACLEAVRWRKAGHRHARVSVNVSALQFGRRDFLETVAAALAISGLAPACLELELTESSVMRDLPQSVARMSQIRELGVSIAIDDFGTGYSSLSYLSKLPVDVLKIDQSFLRGMLEPEGSLPVIQSIVRLAHSMNLTVVAEGVETSEEMDLVRLLGCDKVQGYFYGAALAPEAVEELLAGEERKAAVAG